MCYFIGNAFIGEDVNCCVLNGMGCGFNLMVKVYWGLNGMRECILELNNSGELIDPSFYLGSVSIFLSVHGTAPVC